MSSIDPSLLTEGQQVPVVPPRQKGRARLVAASAKAGPRENARRWIVRLTFIIFFLLIFEGVLRKWAFPGMHKVLFFIRDPFVLMAYFLAFKYDLWPKRSQLFEVGLWLGGAFLGLALLQSMTTEVNPVISIYGWRNYFYYLPLAFLIGHHFRGSDLKALVKYSLIAAIPIAVLCYKQFEAPAGDAINLAYGSGAAMLVNRGIVRTSGTFTVSAAQAIYIGSLLAMLFATWLMPVKQRPLKWMTLLASSGALLTMFAVSGTRSIFFLIALVGGSGFWASHLVNRRINIKRLLTIPIILIVGAIGYAVVFPLSMEVMLERQLMAQASEGSTIFRAFGSFVGVFKVLPSVTLLGSGLGSLTNAASVVTTGMVGQTFIAEDEWSRIVIECGIAGFLYVGYRIALTYTLARDAVSATRRSQNPLPLLLIGFECMTLLIGQMTLQGTINGFGWLFAGFCMAANRLRTRADAKPGDIWS